MLDGPFPECERQNFFGEIVYAFGSEKQLCQLRLAHGYPGAASFQRELAVLLTYEYVLTAKCVENAPWIKSIEHPPVIESAWKEVRPQQLQQSMAAMRSR